MDGSETFQFYYRQHWMRLSRVAQGFILGSITYAAALWLLADTPDEPTRHLLLLIATSTFALLHLVLLARLYTYFLYMIIVTDAKVYRIKQTLLTVDDRQTLDLWSLSDVTMQQHGIVQNILGFGTIILLGNEELRIHFTPRIREKVHRVSVLRTKARGRAMTGDRLPDKSLQRKG